uniref:Uncharacterized protein n=1 Tax=Arundo donax TaxID=35708 RepID=A0A0A9GT64_ARUDO
MVAIRTELTKVNMQHRPPVILVQLHLLCFSAGVPSSSPAVCFLPVGCIG